MGVLMFRELAVKFPFLKHVFDLLRPGHDAAIVKLTEKPLVYRFVGKQPGKVLEIGYGSGPYLGFFARFADFFCGADLSGKVPLEGRIWEKRTQTKLVYITARAHFMPIVDEQFDTVVCCQVLEHILDDLSVLREIKRILKVGGRLILSVPVPPPPVPSNLDLLELGGHVRHGYTLVELTQISTQAGLIITRSAYCAKHWSRLAIQLIHRFQRIFKVAPPVLFFVLLASLDKLMGDGAHGAPYDIVVEAQRE